MATTSKKNENWENRFLVCGFDSKISLDGFSELLNSRSQNFSLPPSFPNRDIWRRKPPDFTPCVYNPKPPKRNSREAIQPWKYLSLSDQNLAERKKDRTSDDECTFPPISNVEADDRGDEGREFVTRFKRIGPHDSRILFVRHGTNRKSAYRMPKPHDFRGYPPIESLGLPEFTTKYERDPFNLKLNRENPRTVLGSFVPVALSYEPPSGAPPLTPPLKWDARLILPKTKWPNKYAAYTRHRRWDRSAYSAKMERIEQNLTEKWKQETLQRHNN